MKLKDDRLSLRINSEDKKKIQKRSIDKGFKNLSDYVMYACNEEMKKEILQNFKWADIVIKSAAVADYQ